MIKPIVGMLCVVLLSACVSGKARHQADGLRICPEGTSERYQPYGAAGGNVVCLQKEDEEPVEPAPRQRRAARPYAIIDDDQYCPHVFDFTVNLSLPEDDGTGIHTITAALRKEVEDITLMPGRVRERVRVMLDGRLVQMPSGDSAFERLPKKDQELLFERERIVEIPPNRIGPGDEVSFDINFPPIKREGVKSVTVLYCPAEEDPGLPSTAYGEGRLRNAWAIGCGCYENGVSLER